MDSIFQYRHVRENIINDKRLKPFSLINLEKNQVYLSKVDDMNDPYEGLHNYQVNDNCREAFCKLFYGNQYSDEMIEDENFHEHVTHIKLNHVKTFLEQGISCFSTRLDSLLMWGHYADSHTGICVEFNHSESIFRQVIEVNYRDEPYTINIENKKELSEDYFTNIANNIVATKHKSWKYEKEYRFIGQVGETYKYSEDSIIGIYFGSKVNEQTICDVYYSSCHIPHIKYYYMELDFENYGMNPVDITNRCHEFAKNNVWINKKIKFNYEYE